MMIRNGHPKHIAPNGQNYQDDERRNQLAKICFPLADNVPTRAFMHVADVRGLEALVIRFVLAADSAISSSARPDQPVCKPD